VRKGACEVRLYLLKLSTEPTYGDEAMGGRVDKPSWVAIVLGITNETK
jgi:hypothetical protein